MSASMWAWRVVVPGAGVLACLVALGLAYQPENDDRSADGAAAGAGAVQARLADDRVIAEGRVVPRAGAEVSVGNELGGIVASVPARAKARVKRGDVLIVLRSEEQEAALTEAEARLAEADAELAYQKREYQRRVRGATESQRYAAELDAVRRDHDVASARQRTATAALAHARVSLARTRIVSPIDGVVLSCAIQPGEPAAPGERLVTVCDLSKLMIEAEVDEFDAPRVSVGAEVTIMAEGYRPASWRGTVEEIPDRVAQRSIRPEDPGRPTDASVLLVKVALAEPMPLRLGQRVEVEIRPPAPPAPEAATVAGKP